MTEKRVLRRLILLCGGPTTRSRQTHIQKLTALSDGIFDETFIFSDDMKPILLAKSEKISLPIRKQNSHKDRTNNRLGKILDLILIDLRKSKEILLKAAPRDVVLCLGIYQPFSIFAARIKQTRLALFGGGFDVSLPKDSRGFLGRVSLSIRWAYQLMALHLVHMLIVESPSVEKNFNLNDFHSKMFMNGRLYVSSTFSVINPIASRKYDFAYIGALEEEKGILEFLESLRIIMNKRKATILIIGSGQFYNRVKSGTWDDSLITIKHLLFVNHDDMPKMLNQVKLLVLPSKSEGVPNILMEAMTCGTPILATPVGGIPDFIRDGNTGFILHSNKPEYIADAILKRITNLTILDTISSKALLQSKKLFSLRETKKIWREIYIELLKN